jgi:hypothetical protein
MTPEQIYQRLTQLNYSVEPNPVRGHNVTFPDGRVFRFECNYDLEQFLNRIQHPELYFSDPGLNRNR